MVNYVQINSARVRSSIMYINVKGVSPHKMDHSHTPSYTLQIGHRPGIKCPMNNLIISSITVTL